MNIRLATEDDISQLVRMGRLFWSQTPYSDTPYCPDSIAYTLREMMSQRLLLVADDEGKLAGSVGSLAYPLYANRDVLVASELFWWVEPEYRNSGAGKLLLSGMEMACRAAGVKRLSMSAFNDLDLEKATAVYKRFGYTLSEQTFCKAL